ncbi:MAG: hypothetical protein VX278_15795 [Myxococcota bacterium]|nr:hypothetical protein [Myxococcota bacterium]
MFWLYALVLGGGCRNASPSIRTFGEMPLASLFELGSLRVGDASSFYTEGAIVHEPDRAGDSQPKTAWCEGAKGGGEGEWLSLQSSCEASIDGLVLINGLAESRAIFPQFNRVAKAKMTLRIDDQLAWTESVRVLDRMQKQYLSIPTVNCGEESVYRIRLEIEDYHSGNGHTCLSEVVPVSLDQKEPSIVRGVSNCRTLTYAKDSLRFYAGPGEKYAFLGMAPVYPTQYGAPIVRIVEQEVNWLRVESIQRAFAENERPAASVDPNWGGWVHAKQLSFQPLEKGLYQSPSKDAAVFTVDPIEPFEFQTCQGTWVQIAGKKHRGWSQLFCPEDRGCF